jgi:flavin prenyltransferase
MNTSRLIIGISGASGIIYGIRLLELLKETPYETHLIISKSAHITLKTETDYTIDAIKKLADSVYTATDIAACIASGSFLTDGMIIAPCSVRTMSNIATGTTDTLMSRAADVTLKERRKLVLMVRETPLHLGHLRTMTSLAEMGAIIAPPVPAFYSRPESLMQLVDHSVCRVLDLFSIHSPLVKRWQGDI